MKAREQCIVTVNAGSSSVRLSAFDLDDPARELATQHCSPAPPEPERTLRAFIDERRLPAPRAVAHRVVHGGVRLTSPCLVDESVEREIERLGVLAPLHNPVALDWIRAARRACGDEVVQIAAFDTGFYRDLPAVAAHYALPADLTERHAIRRYGFHGLAHQFMVMAWHERAGEHERSVAQERSGTHERSRTHEPGAVHERSGTHDRRDMRERSATTDARVISLQLGAGCSVTASRGGRPVETSMGFSPLEGLMMATRCGDLDPAVVLHLLQRGGLDADEIGRLLNHGSGLLGVSGLSGDMETLLASNAPAAALAVAMFCHRARKYVGAYLAVLGGADAILFGGGIGEHAPAIRAGIVAGLEWAGIRLDPTRNASGASTIHAGDSPTEIHVISVDEGQLLARHARELIAASANEVRNS